MWVRKSLVVFLIVGVTGGLLGCSKKASDLASGTGAGQGIGEEDHLSVLHVTEKDDVKTWDPANAYDSVSLDLLPNVYETLYQYRYLSEVYRPEPLLAEGMPVYSSDAPPSRRKKGKAAKEAPKLTVTIRIKQGVEFQKDPCFPSGTRELKAHDFVYAIKRLALPSLQSNGWWTIDGKLVGINAFHDRLSQAKKSEIPSIMAEEIEGVKALDDYTLQFKLTKPYPQLIYILCMSFTAPMAHEAVEKYGDERGNVTDHAVGTGPFVLAFWKHNHQIQLERNKNFRKDLYPSSGSQIYMSTGMLADAGKPMPFVDRIVVNIMKEDQPRWLKFMNGDVDMLALPKDNFKQAITDQVNLSPELVKKGIHLGIETGVVVRYVSFNMKDKLVGSNKYLRQALSAAIDRNQWIAIFTNGTGKKMVNSIPPGIADRSKRKEIKYDYDLAKAKALLEKAGYPGGQGLPPLKFDLRGASTTDRQLGDLFQQLFAKIGVQLEVVPNTFPAFLEKLKQGNLQISFGGWSMDYPDAENIYQLFYGPNKAPGPGDSSFDDPVFNKLYEQMAVLEPGPKRAELIRQMEDILQEELPLAMGYYEASYDLSQPWFMNYRGSSIIVNKYKYFKVDPEIKKRYLSPL